MAAKKSEKIAIKAEKVPVKVDKASIRAAKPAAKSIVRKEEVSTPVAKKKTEYQRVQTAEGWQRMKKREMMKK